MHYEADPGARRRKTLDSFGMRCRRCLGSQEEVGLREKAAVRRMDASMEGSDGEEEENRRTQKERIQ